MSSFSIYVVELSHVCLNMYLNNQRPLGDLEISILLSNNCNSTAICYVPEISVKKKNNNNRIILIVVFDIEIITNKYS